MTPAVCLHASSGGTGGAEGEGTRENDTLSGLWGAAAPGEDWRTGGVAEEAGGQRASALPFAHPLRSPSGRGIRGGDWAGGAGAGGRSEPRPRSLPQPARWRWRRGSEAAGGHFSCGAAESPGGPPRLNTSIVPRSRPPPGGRSPPRGQAVPCRAGRGGRGHSGRGSEPPGGVRRGGVVSTGSGRKSEQRERRERAGSRYLYWAAAAAAAAPLWVNPK